jgi:DNA (cytosine-5)-methyltransferase 1
MILRIGTDCSGIEAPIEALRQLQIPHRHIWSCEIDKYARQSIEANYKPEIMYEDITKRDHKKLPDIDLYVCGFPCQPFSLIGKKKGTLDSRSNIMKHCIKVIKAKSPKIFILENVKNFKYIEDGNPYNYLISKLENIKKYNIYVDTLNTRDYGIPQNRDRLYVIGILKVHQVKEYVKPHKLPLKPLDNFIENKNVHKAALPQTIACKLVNIDQKSSYICPFNKYTPCMKAMCPTLTASASSSKYMYHTKYKRYLTYKECLMLQGFNKDFKKVVSDLQMFKQIGNSMSVNVLKCVLSECILCCKT